MRGIPAPTAKRSIKTSYWDPLRVSSVMHVASAPTDFVKSPEYFLVDKKI